jgi:hypothetical protein
MEHFQHIVKFSHYAKKMILKIKQIYLAIFNVRGPNDQL